MASWQMITQDKKRPPGKGLVVAGGLGRRLSIVSIV